MKFRNSLKALLVLVFTYSQVAMGQVGSPSAGMGTLFERFPVETSTGLPQVSIPLYSMPTRSKDINLDISLSYHQASIRNSGLRSGNCGRGWYLSLGGAIQLIDRRFPIYSFNFMGYSGKLTAIKFANGTKFIQITDNKGPQVYVDTFYSSNGSLESINFYDNKGYKYVFNIIDITNTPRAYPDYDVIDALRTSYQLSDVYDANNNLLLHLNYTANDDIIKMYGIDRHNTVNTVSSINISGFGSIIMNATGLEDDDGVWHMYAGFIVNDLSNNVIKNVDFNYDSDIDVNTLAYTRNDLANVIISGSASDFQEYDFSYHPIVKCDESLSSYVNGFDAWGYPSVISTFCKSNEYINHLLDRKNVMSGVL